MTTTAEVALSYQLALTNQLDITANNITNMSTTGFQSSQPLFAQYLVDVDKQGNNIAFVEDRGTLRNTASGPLNFTGNSMDLGLQGSGYFVVEQDGEFLYTRNGSFRLDESGRLVTNGGAVVMDEQDNPIVFSPDESVIEISRDGSVRTENGEIGQLRIVNFADQQDMELIGSSLLRTNQVPFEAAGTEVVQGMLEGSNVIAISEMTRMIELLRS